MVPNTSELLPEPDTPVNAVSRRFGISTLTSFRLFTRAPVTRIMSWLSATCSSRLMRVSSGKTGSGGLVDPDVVPGRVAERTVADAVRLVHRLLDDLRVGRLQALEQTVEVVALQHEGGVGALGHHLADGTALVLGEPGIDGRRRQDDRGVRLFGRPDRDPAHVFVPDVEA